MAHKTLIDGTAYEISGGKTLVNGTEFNIKNGKTLVDDTAYGIEFNNWPDDLDTGLEFVSASTFTIEVPTVIWDGTMEYCNGDEGWKTWDGSEISSGETRNGQCIYIRGTNNTKVSEYTNGWKLNGTDIQCNGNIEKLLDYATVSAGNHPTMANYCYNSMFYGCTSLTAAPSLPATTLTAMSCYALMFYGCTNLTAAPSLPATTLTKNCYAWMFERCTSLTSAPSLPATTLVEACYKNMFFGCTNLTTIPSLPATTLAMECYSEMFYLCTKIKLSSSSTDTYTKAYRIPYSGTGTTAILALEGMFSDTGGTFTGTPEINTTYYLDSSNTIV